MNKYPAIALIEFSSISTGFLSGDAMVKQAPITVLKSGTVHNGKFLVMIGGSVASVEESFYEGILVGGNFIIDKVMLPFVHEQVHDAILGIRKPCLMEAVGIIETRTVAATIQSADAGVKGAMIDIVEIRLADDLGGKAFSVFTGKLEEVEAAVEISKSKVTNPDYWINDTIIPNLHTDLKQQINCSTSFSLNELNQLANGEI